MALASGTHLGSYEIISAIGAGGMGDVYRARDTKLARDVALKVLPTEFALDPERLARFRREAQVRRVAGWRAIPGEHAGGGTHADVAVDGRRELARRSRAIAAGRDTPSTEDACGGNSTRRIRTDRPAWRAEWARSWI
jgi:hypothetical protein